MIEVGDPLPDLAVEIRDSSDALANAGAVALTITLPDLTTTQPAVSNPSTGRYTATYITAQAGRHLARWVATGANASTHSEAYDVREAAWPAIISLDDAKDHLNMTATDRARDDELRGWIEAATEIIENDPEHGVGAVVIRSHTQRHETARKLILIHTPVVSLTTVTPWLTSGTTYAAADLRVDPVSGIVERKDGGCFTGGPFEVVYKSGRAIIPANIVQAAKIIVQHMWETQRGGSRRPGMGGDETSVVGLGYAVPNRALELLAPHKRAPLMA